MFNSGGHRLHLCTRLLQSYTRLQPRPGKHPVKIARHVFGLKGQRQPEIGKTAVKGRIRSHNADYRIRFIVQADGSSDNSFVRAKAAFPDSVAQYHNMLLARLVFIRGKCAAQHRFYLKDVKVRCGYACATQLHRNVNTGESDGSSILCRHGAENRVLVLSVEEVHCGNTVAFAVRRLFPDHYDLVCVRIRKWLEQNSINEAENSSVCADPQRQSEHSDNCESRTGAHHAQRVTKVVYQLIHIDSTPGSGFDWRHPQRVR